MEEEAKHKLKPLCFDPTRPEVLYNHFAAVRMVEQAIDIDGRPLGELELQDHGFALPEDCDFQLKRCPYPGKRENHPMNVGALRVLSRQFPAVIAQLARLRREYSQWAGFGPRTALEILDFQMACAALPAYLMRRAHSSVPNHQLGGDITSLWKAIIGAAAPCARQVSQGDAHLVLSPEFFNDEPERSGSFLLSDRACAGPPHMIHAVGKALTQDDDEQADSDDAARLDALVGDWTSFFCYAKAVQCIDLLYSINQASNHLLALELRAALAAAPPTAEVARVLERQPWHGRPGRPPEALPRQRELSLGALERSLLRIGWSPEQTQQALLELIPRSPQPALQTRCTDLIATYSAIGRRIDEATCQTLSALQLSIDKAAGRRDRAALPWRSILEGYSCEVPSAQAIQEQLARPTGARLT